MFTSSAILFVNFGVFFRYVVGGLE